MTTTTEPTIERATFLQPLPGKRERVEMPEFGEGQYLWIHGLNARDKSNHDASLMDKKWEHVDRKKAKQQKELLIIRCARDDAGQRLFSFEDVEALGDWPADILNRVFDVANRLSGGATDSVADTGKNSDETGGD